MKQEITQFIGKVKLGAKKNAPELLLAGALVTGTATVVLTGIASAKAADVRKDFLEAKMSLEYETQFGDITDEEVKSKVKEIYLKYGLSLVRDYAIPVGLYGATVGMIFASYKIQKNRQVALSTALAACTAAYNTLIGKLTKGASFGLTAKEVLDGIEAREVTNEETGEVTVEKYQGPKVDASIYKFRFDEFTSRAWEKDKFQNECTLKSEENWANDKLRVDGYLFLNDVLDRLGIDRIPAGQIVGWRYNKGNGDNYVDFRVVDEAIYVDPENPKQIFYNGDFVCNSGENAYTLDFNCDGDILTDF